MTDEQRPVDDPTYALMLQLDQLESLREEMDELAAATADDLARSQAPAPAAVLAELRALGLASVAELEARIAALHRQLDTLTDAPET